jgi:hypothetical protein
LKFDFLGSLKVAKQAELNLQALIIRANEVRISPPAGGQLL